MSSHLHILKERLPHTWDALLARFGRFTDIQAQALCPLLDGKNCMLVSATASGKTEAALAPLIERHKRSSRKGLSILYIVPTRALARDLARRLDQPLNHLAVPMRVKTGDEPALNTFRPPELLITTPESFDSMLTSRPRMVKDVRAVVLDEIHIFDNTARGDQLRILLNRLRRIKSYALSRGDIRDDDLQFCALSATVHDPMSVASRYFTNPVVIATGGRRAIDAELIAMEGAESLNRLFAGLKSQGRKKLLVFCTRRAECEEWAHAFRTGSPFGDRVFVHHASLDARMRRAVEKNFSDAEAALCFATSTLELGIDIGDVDLVALIGAPASTSGFLQRIGRGSRRTSRTAVVCFYRTEIEEAMFQVFLSAAESGELESDAYFFRPSVIVQQLCSYIKQTRFGEIDPDSAYELFSSPEGVPLISKSQYDKTVGHLILKGFFISPAGGMLRPGPAWQELYERREIYTNLVDTKPLSIDVFDEMTGRRLGEIGMKVARGSTFLFGGQARRARRVEERKLIVRPAEEAEEAKLPRFRTPWRPLNHRLARSVAARLDVPYAESGAHIAMVSGREETEDEGSTEISERTNRAWIFHCAGDAYGLVLGDMLEALYKVNLEDYNGLYLTVTGQLPAGPLRMSAEQVRTRLRRRWHQFESWYDMGRFQSHLPLEVRRASVIEAFDIEEFLRTFADRDITEIKPD
ncbi:MAG: DEAD/DEAH box helicase [Blastocatellia bacterium]|nr:DEAD/DEAH box helicase [Blastocatellia bacterium]